MSLTPAASSSEGQAEQPQPAEQVEATTESASAAPSVPSSPEPAKPAVWIPREIIGVIVDGDEAVTIAPRAVQISGRVPLALRVVVDDAARAASERCWDELEAFGVGEC